MIREIGEIVLEIRKNPENAVEILQRNRTMQLVEFLEMANGHNPLFSLPKIEFPFKPSKEPFGQSNVFLRAAVKKFRIWRMVGARHPDKLTMSFVALLEELHPIEAQILLDAHLGRLDIGVPWSVICDALPMVTRSVKDESLPSAEVQAVVTEEPKSVAPAEPVKKRKRTAEEVKADEAAIAARRAKVAEEKAAAKAARKKIK
jgi:hypothetical protein